METLFEVIGIFKTLAGEIIILRLPNSNSTISQGTILRNDTGSKLKILGIGNGKKPNLENSNNDDLRVMNFRIEWIYGKNILAVGDLLYLD